MPNVVPAPMGTICGNYKCQRVVATDDLNIIRYMGKIYHVWCLNDQIMRRARVKNIFKVRKEQKVTNASL